MSSTHESVSFFRTWASIPEKVHTDHVPGLYFFEQEGDAAVGASSSIEGRCSRVGMVIDQRPHVPGTLAACNAEPVGCS